jgi:hypothetical protein
MSKVHERVPFRLLSCPKCRFLCCWINPRLPNYCSECGKAIVAWNERVMMADDEAILTTKGPQLAGGNYIDD